MNKWFLLFYSVLFTFLSFKSNAQVNYTYNFISKVNSPDSNDLNSTISHLFSTYDKYLFEYILVNKEETKVNTALGTSVKKLSFDTLGIYIVDLIKKEGIQIDSFSKNFKIIGNVNTQINSFALKIYKSYTPSNNKTNVQCNIVDTVIENQNYKYLSDTAKGLSGSDSIVTKSFFAPIRRLLTPWGLNNSISQLPNFTLTGFSIFFLAARVTITFNVQEVKLLGKKEEEISGAICEALKKSGLLP